jgi:cytochrome bd-type quinol oxidase subunit 2
MVNKAFALTFQTISGFGPFQTGGSDPGGTLDLFFTTLLGVFTIVGGLAFIIYFIVGAFNWLASGGDKERISRAQRYLSNALIGLVLIVLAWAIIGILGLLLGFNVLDLVNLIGQVKPT